MTVLQVLQEDKFAIFMPKEIVPKVGIYLDRSIDRSTNYSEPIV